MKFMNVYTQIMSDQVEQIASGKNVLDNMKKRLEWRAIAVAEEYPDASNEVLYEHFTKAAGQNYSMKEFLEVLRAVNLDRVGKRKYIRKLLQRNAALFKKFLNGDRSAAKQLGEYMDNLTERDKEEGRQYFKAKYLLVYLQLFTEGFQTKHGEAVLENYLEAYCTRVLRNIYRNVCRKIGFKKTTREVLESTQRALKETQSQVYEEQKGDSQTQQIERLQFEINNYRNTLELVQSMFDELKDTVEESANEAKDSAVGEFFAALNANEYGNLLDSTIRVEECFAHIRAQQVKLPPQVQPLVILFKQFLRFIKEYGIQPIEEQGRCFDVVYGDIEKLNYQGEAFTADEEVKQVEVVAPGWKYGDVIISLPTVREK